MEVEKDKFILDACCGGRMFWFNKHHPNALYIDNRIEEKGLIKERPDFEVKPDVVMDFRAMALPDKSFKLVVWDPPHLKSLVSKSWIAKKYGSLQPDSVESDLTKGFKECWRVLKDDGVLIFKWSEECNSRSIKVKQLIKWFGVEPLFGHTSGSKNKTIWMCFMKMVKK